MSSGGGSVPKAPDLSGNINNANQTFGTATSSAAQTMNTAQALNKQAQSNLGNVVNQSNSMAQKIGDTANQNLSTYGSTFSPLQKTEAQAAQNYGSTANIQRLQGQAVADQGAASAAARANSAHALAAEGVDPASIHGAALDRQAAVAGAANAASAGTQASINAQNEAFNRENAANQLGLQVGNAGTAGAETAAQTGIAGQEAENSTNAGNVNNLTASNTFLNTGINANNSGEKAANDQFGDQMQAYQAQQAASSSAMSSIGSIAGAAMMFMERGGVVPHGPRGIPVARGVHDYAAGGSVTSKGAFTRSPIPGSTDTKPALLTPGEFVIPKDVVDYLGQEHFHKLIDKTRVQSNTRRAIPVQHSPHVSMH